MKRVSTKIISKRKQLASSKNFVKGYLHNLVTVADNFLSSKNDQVLSTLIDKQLISSDDAVIEENQQSEENLEHWIQEKIVRLSAEDTSKLTDKTNVHRKSTEGLLSRKFKQARMLKTEADQP